MRPIWYELRAANDPVLENRERLEKRVAIHSYSTKTDGYYYLEFSSRTNSASRYEYLLQHRSNGKSVVAGCAMIYRKSLEILLDDATTYEAIHHVDNTDSYPDNTYWLLAKNGLETGKLTTKAVERTTTGIGFLSWVVHKIIGGSVAWQVTLPPAQFGEMQIDYPIGSNKTSRRQLQFANIALPVHLSRSADYDPASEAQDFRYPHLWDDDYVLPVGTPNCSQPVLELAFLLNIFFRLYYKLDFSSS